MIDAVISSVQTAPLLRGNADQTSTTDSFAANPARTQKVAEQSYVSPYYEIDETTQALIYELRDTSTGKALLKISSRDTEATGTYDGSAQIRTASQTLSGGATPGQQTRISTPVQTPQQDNSPQSATDDGTDPQTALFAQQAAAFANAAQSGNSNAGATSFDQLV